MKDIFNVKCIDLNAGHYTLLKIPSIPKKGPFSQALMMRTQDLNIIRRSAIAKEIRSRLEGVRKLEFCM